MAALLIRALCAVCFIVVAADGHRHESDHVVFYSRSGHLARHLAREHNLRYISEVFPRSNYHHAVMKPGSMTPSSLHRLSKDPRIEWIERQTYQPRALRFLSSRQRAGINMMGPRPIIPISLAISTPSDVPTRFNDPLYPQQWYLHGNSNGDRHHLNVVPVWDQGLTGRGVSVVVLDDNVNPSNEEIRLNYDAGLSADLGVNEHGPDVKKNPVHGTYCAAVIAAEANNSYCGVGVAFKARVGGVRLLVKKRVMDVHEAKALNHQLDQVDIYSASWGPPDDGKHLGGPGHLASHALERGVTLGRKGLGAIYVWASGNGGIHGDHCGYDSYASSPYTLTVSALTPEGLSPYYAEPCPAALTSLYVGGHHMKSDVVPGKNDDPHNVVVPEWNGGCQSGFQGTSAAAPLAAGIIALLLEANPRLTWRDVHHLVVLSSSPPGGDENQKEAQWDINGAGLRSNVRYGFGALDADRLISLGRTWVNVPPRRQTQVYCSSLPRQLRIDEPNRLVLPIGKDLKNAEYVTVTLDADVKPYRGLLSVALQSPSGLISQLLMPRPSDVSTDGFRQWNLTSAQFWKEDPSGLWSLSLSIHPVATTGTGSHTNDVHQGFLHSCSLIVFGY